MLLRRVIAHFRKQEWTAIFLDFLIVVVGVFVGLQVNNWNEARKDRARERAYLMRVATELDQSIASLESGVELTKMRAAYGEFLLDSIDRPEVVSAEPGRFIAAVVQAGYTYSPNIRGHTFEEIKSAGDLDILRDKELLFDLTEFHTAVKGSEQWNYLRELYQTEYTKRSAGILTLEQMALATRSGAVPEIASGDAMTAYKRMLERPDFIEWLPGVAERSTAVHDYSAWLASARELRARIGASLDMTVSEGGAP